jgi:hypothetical protein
MLKLKSLRCKREKKEAAEKAAINTLSAENLAQSKISLRKVN